MFKCFFSCRITLFLLLIAVGITSCSTTKSILYIDELSQEQKKVSSNRLEQITNLWVGHFSNKASIGNRESQMNVEQEIIGRRIWKTNRVEEYWIYAGWFQAGSYEAALSSSIAQITKVSPDTAFITFYRIKDHIAIDAYEWTKDKPFDKLKKSDLLEAEEGCGSFIVKDKNGNFQVIANKPCFSPMSDQLKYYKIDAEMRADRIIFNTKFLSETHKILLHYKDNIFIRFNKNELERRYAKFASN